MERNPSVFIVDDDATIRESLAVLVSSIGLTAEVFSSGLEYLNQFDSQSPGVLILDVRMPQMGGLAVLERLSKEPLHPPVIIMTGFADVPVAIRALRVRRQLLFPLSDN